MKTVIKQTLSFYIHSSQTLITLRVLTFWGFQPKPLILWLDYDFMTLIILLDYCSSILYNQDFLRQSLRNFPFGLCSKTCFQKINYFWVIFKRLHFDKKLISQNPNTNINLKWVQNKLGLTKMKCKYKNKVHLNTIFQNLNNIEKWFRTLFLPK